MLSSQEERKMKKIKQILCAILAFSVILGGCSAKSSEETEKQEDITKLETDVVVVGSGMAGLSASIAARDAGASVILIEKQVIIGGSAALASGGFAVTGTHQEKEAGVEDTVEDALDRWMNWENVWNARRENTPNLFPEEDKVRLVVERTAENIDWMESLGVKFKTLLPYTNNMTRLLADYPDLGTGGSGVVKVLKESAEAKGVTIMTETPGTELIIEDGKVVGIRSDSKGKVTEIRAKSVILTTGGFASNPDMLAEYVPEFAGAMSLAAVGNTGDGIKMAIAAGAALYEDPWVISNSPSVNDAYVSKNKDAKSLPYVKTAMVNAKGERFINEASWYSAFSNSMALIEGQEYSLYDSSDEERVQILEDGVSCGEVVKAETLVELAEALGMDASVLEETVNTFNDVVAGKIADPFILASSAQGIGVGQGASENDLLSISVGPFYAVKMSPTIMGTMGGVKTDEKGHVLNESGEVIPGLYAAGEMSNRCFYEYTYLGAGSLSSYSIMGRIAGENAAKD